jgi:hypothetical protein
MSTIDLAVGTDENGIVWVYRFATRDEAVKFAAAVNRDSDLDMSFEHVPVFGTVTLTDALGELREIKLGTDVA